MENLNQLLTKYGLTYVEKKTVSDKTKNKRVEAKEKAGTRESLVGVLLEDAVSAYGKIKIEDPSRFKEAFLPARFKGVPDEFLDTFRLAVSAEGGKNRLTFVPKGTKKKLKENMASLQLDWNKIFPQYKLKKAFVPFQVPEDLTEFAFKSIAELPKTINSRKSLANFNRDVRSCLLQQHERELYAIDLEKVD